MEGFYFSDLKIGSYNTMKVVKRVDFGLYLQGEKTEEILLPNRYVPEGLEEGDSIDVFVYLDNEERPVATTIKPIAVVGDFACMRVREVNQVGAFLEWGLMKDILVPFREQKIKMEAERWYVVYIFLDEQSKRIVATSHLDRYLDNYPANYSRNEEVQLMIAGKTDIGYKAIINNTHWGLIYNNEVFGKIKMGDKITGYIKEVREDGKIDLSLSKQGYENVVDDLSNSILNILTDAGGFLPVHDKSPTEEIYDTFKCSKKSFKKALGNLYKLRKVTIESDGIYLIAED